MTNDPIKNMVRDNKRVTFVHYRNGELIYSTECGFEFPVPTSDVGSATLLASDKALLFMRYIRKALAERVRIQKMLEESRSTVAA